VISAITSFTNRLPKLISDNSPAILTAIGAAGALTTAYLTGRASIKAGALYAIDDLQRRHNDEPEMEWKEFVKEYWRLYIPSAISAGLTVAAIISANRIGTRRTAALATAFAISEKAFDEYRNKVVEKLGDKKEELIRAEVAQERVNRKPPVDREVIVTGNGSVLCQDALTGRYFLCDLETIRKAENDINWRVLHDNYASLSDFYELVGLPPTSMSDEVGWNVDKLLEIKVSGTLTEGGNKPCMYIEFTIAPVRGYSRLM
jgi:uncharacterized protein DUF6353